MSARATSMSAPIRRMLAVWLGLLDADFHIDDCPQELADHFRKPVERARPDVHQLRRSTTDIDGPAVVTVLLRPVVVLLRAQSHVQKSAHFHGPARAHLRGTGASRDNRVELRPDGRTGVAIVAYAGFWFSLADASWRPHSRCRSRTCLARAGARRPKLLNTCTLSTLEGRWIV